MTGNGGGLEEAIGTICHRNNIAHLKLVEFKLEYPRDEDQSDRGHIRYIHILPNNLKKVVDSYEDERQEIRRKDGSGGEHDIRESNSEYLLGVTSNVILKDGTSKHMFFLDFDCDVCGENLTKVRHLLEIYNVTPGFIVLSGRSYHFYSVKLYEEKEWIEMLKDIDWPDKGLIDVNDEVLEKIGLQSIVDKIWLRNQIYNRYSTLRLSRNLTCKTVKPYVLEAIDL